MPREHAIVKRIRTRIEVKTKELGDVDAKIDSIEETLGTLRAQRLGLVIGIDEDEELLSAAAPKLPRQKKAKAPQTLGQQMGTDPKEGQD